MNAKLLIGRSSAANAEELDGAPPGNAPSRYTRKGLKTKSKVAQLFGLQLTPISGLVQLLHNPFAAAASFDSRSFYITDTKLGAVMCAQNIDFDGATAVLRQCCKVTEPRGVAVLDASTILVINGGDNCVDFWLVGSFTLLRKVAIPDAHKPHSIAVQSASKFYVTDFEQHSLKCCDSQSQWSSTITGDASKQPLRDGVVSSSSLHQPQTMAFAGSSLFVADSGNGAIRLVTNPGSMKLFLTKLREYLQSFGIPKQKEPLSVARCKEKASALSVFLEEMAENNLKRSTRGFSGEGPDGNVSEVNRSQLKWMGTGIETVESELLLLQHSHLLDKVNPSALQELVCEHFFAQMRKNNMMPTQAEYYCRRCIVLLEMLKKRMPRNYHYFTGSKAKHYLMDGAGATFRGFEYRKKLSRRKVVGGGSDWATIKEQRAELVEFQKSWGSGVKQNAVRAKTIKEDTGTKPYALSFRPERAVLVQTEGDLQVANVVESEVVQNPAAPERGRSWAQVVYRRGDFVGLSPNKEAHKLHTGSGKVWYSQLLADVVYIHQRVPKAVGSRKWVTEKKLQNVYAAMRWLEPCDVQVDGTSGVLYEWDDGDFDGPGKVEEACKANSIACTTSFVPEVGSDGVERYRLAEGEASRVGDRCLDSSSDSEPSNCSDSSDGIVDDLRIDVVEQQALELVQCLQKLMPMIVFDSAQSSGGVLFVRAYVCGR